MIVGKGDRSKLPADLDRLAKEAMRCQVRSSIDYARYEEMKAEFFEKVRDSPDVVMETGVSLRATEGLVCWHERTNYTVSKDKLAELFRKRKLSLSALLSMVREFDHTLVEQFAPSATWPSEPTEYGSMSAFSTFKEQVRTELETAFPEPRKKPEKKKASPAAPDIMPKLKASLKQAKRKGK